MASTVYSLLITLLVISTLLCSAMAQQSPAPPPQPAAGCISELVLFSPCLSFVSAPPNNLSETVPSKCCDAFLSSINSGDGFCLCYLISQPRILGFPLNESRVLSLPLACSPGNNESARIGYFMALCPGSCFFLLLLENNEFVRFPINFFSENEISLYDSIFHFLFFVSTIIYSAHVIFVEQGLKNYPLSRMEQYQGFQTLLILVHFSG